MCMFIHSGLNHWLDCVAQTQTAHIQTGARDDVLSNVALLVYQSIALRISKPRRKLHMLAGWNTRQALKLQPNLTSPLLNHININSHQNNDALYHILPE